MYQLLFSPVIWPSPTPPHCRCWPGSKKARRPSPLSWSPSSSFWSSSPMPSLECGRWVGGGTLHVEAQLDTSVTATTGEQVPVTALCPAGCCTTETLSVSQLWGHEIGTARCRHAGAKENWSQPKLFFVFWNHCMEVFHHVNVAPRVHGVSHRLLTNALGKVLKLSSCLLKKRSHINHLLSEVQFSNPRLNRITF